MIRLSACAYAVAVFASPAAAGPLHDAVKAGDFAQVKSLVVQGENVNQSQFPIGTPLHYAALSGNTEIAAFLLTAGATIDADEPSLGTPLKTAALKGHEQVAALLIANGADVRATSGDGTTPLHAAAQGGHASMVEFLIESGADVNARSVSMSGTPPFGPIHSAGEALHFDIVDLLRAYGATGPTVIPARKLLTSADSAKGEELFNIRCSGCHSVEQGVARAGPNLLAVLGRDKASVENYNYSPAFRRLVGIWTPTELNAFIAGPTDYVPGTNMRAEGLVDPTERANLVAFLMERGRDPALPQRP